MLGVLFISVLQLEEEEQLRSSSLDGRQQIFLRQTGDNTTPLALPSESAAAAPSNVVGE
jgi:hypothetical protein